MTHWNLKDKKDNGIRTHTMQYITFKVCVEYFGNHLHCQFSGKSLTDDIPYPLGIIVLTNIIGCHVKHWWNLIRNHNMNFHSHSQGKHCDFYLESCAYPICSLYLKWTVKRIKYEEQQMYMGKRFYCPCLKKIKCIFSWLIWATRLYGRYKCQGNGQKLFLIWLFRAVIASFSVFVTFSLV